MNVVLFGASGMIGSRVLKELAARGHTVTAVARHPERIGTLDGAKVLRGDVTDQTSVAAAAKGADAAVSAYNPPPDDPEAVLPVTRILVAALNDAGVSRLIVVGGAGSLEIGPGLQLVDSPDFPEAWKGVALAHRNVLPILRESGLDWTYLSPSALIEPGERTGRFRLGDTRLLSDARGESRISAEDYAVALVDELENPRHLRRQFTVGY
jgi:uncharacterized protein